MATRIIRTLTELEAFFDYCANEINKFSNTSYEGYNGAMRSFVRTLQNLKTSHNITIDYKINQLSYQLNWFAQHAINSELVNNPEIKKLNKELKEKRYTKINQLKKDIKIVKGKIEKFFSSYGINDVKLSFITNLTHEYYDGYTLNIKDSQSNKICIRVYNDEIYYNFPSMRFTTKTFTTKTEKLPSIVKILSKMSTNKKLRDEFNEVLFEIYKEYYRYQTLNSLNNKEKLASAFKKKYPNIFDYKIDLI